MVLYDDGCSLCTFQMRMLTWLDWFHSLSLVPVSSPKVSKIAPSLTNEQLMEAIHCVTPEGQIHRGARCIRHLGMRLPILIPLGLILWIPGIIWIAERVYMWVSRNRQLLSRVFGCKGACAILPPRESHKD